MSYEDRSGGGVLGRVAVVVGALAAAATIVGVGWTIFARENTEVPDYQNRVVAACDQVREVLTAEHNEVYVASRQGLRVRKDLLVAVMRNNLGQARIAFDALNEERVPQALDVQHDAALEAQAAWFATFEGVIATVQERLPENPRVERLQELGVELGGSQLETARLNSALTALAGRSCLISDADAQGSARLDGPRAGRAAPAQRGGHAVVVLFSGSATAHDLA